MLENDYLLRKDTSLLRDELCDFLEMQYPKVRIMEEKNLGKIRADLLLILPCSIVGIEIKSSSDTYDRLQNQVKGYNKYCDFCYLCAGDTHIHAAEHIPDFWGMISMHVRDGVTFAVTREPTRNPKDRLKNQLSLLWKNELSHILQIHKLPKYKDKSKKFVIEKLLLKVDAETLKTDVSDCLFERDYTVFDE